TSATATANGIVNGTTTLSATSTSYRSDSTLVTVKVITIGFTPVGTIGGNATRSVTPQVLLSDAAPPCGVVVNLVIADTTSITVAAGDTFADFPVSGLALTTSPVTISAAAPGWLTGTYSVTVVTATFAFYYGVPTARTTLSAAHPIAVYTFTPGCGYNCDS